MLIFLRIQLLQSSDEIAALASTHSLIPSDHDHDLKFPVGFVEGKERCVYV